MRSTSRQLANVLTSSHRLATRVDILDGTTLIAADIGDVIDASLTFDRTAAVLGTGTASIAVGLDNAPLLSTSTLRPNGKQLRIWRGAYIPGQTEPEVLALGTFPIQTSRWNARSGVASVTLADRSQLVADARVEDTYQISSGQSYTDEIQAFIAAGVDGLTYNYPSTIRQTPRLTFLPQSDRLANVHRMATSLGWWHRFDGQGVATMSVEPSFSDTPVATIEGTTTLLDILTDMSRIGAYNRAIATSNNTGEDDVYRGVATDDESDSETQYSGTFGKKPLFFVSEFLGSDEQAAEAAEAALRSRLGLAGSIIIDVFPDPRLEAGDVIQVVWSKLGLSALFMIDVINMGLGPESTMQLTIRAEEGAVTVA